MLESILETYPDEQFKKMTGFDHCIIGLCEISNVLVYSKVKIIETLISDEKLEYEEALEHYNKNIVQSCFYEGYPIVIDDGFNI